jgi:hypothetical protein
VIVLMEGEAGLRLGEMVQRPTRAASRVLLASSDAWRAGARESGVGLALFAAFRQCQRDLAGMI